MRPLWRRPWLYCAAKPSPAGSAGLRSAEETEEGTTTVPMPVEEYGFDEDDVEKTLCGSASRGCRDQRLGTETNEDPRTTMMHDE